jgi:mandelate racemase
MVIHHAPALGQTFAIAQWSAWPLSVSLSKPYRSVKGTLSAIPMLHTQIRAAEGLVGNSVVYVLSIALLKSVLAVVSGLGLELGEVRRTALDHASTMRRKLGAWGHEGVGACALCALELALLDAVSQHAGNPIAALFGATAKTLAVYGGIGLGDVIETVGEAERLVDAGHRALKLKLGHLTLDEDLSVLRAVRQSVGDSIRLMVDYNQSLSVDEAIRRGQALELFDLMWIEEPVGAADLEGHAAVASALRICLQSGENWWQLQHIRRAIELHACDAVMLDPAKLGIYAWLEAASTAESAGISVSSHLSPHLCSQLLNATEGAGWLECSDWWDAFVGPTAVREGTVQPSGSPVAWDAAALLHCRVS